MQDRAYRKMACFARDKQPSNGVAEYLLEHLPVGDGIRTRYLAKQTGYIKRRVGRSSEVTTKEVIQELDTAADLTGELEELICLQKASTDEDHRVQHKIL